MLPFSREAFFAVFAHYNAAIWPAHIAAYALGGLLVLLALKPRPGNGRIVAAVLAIAWLWMGIVYHMLYFAPINWGAWVFGTFFIGQGLLLAWAGIRGKLDVHFKRNLFGAVGLGFIAFSMILYPLIGLATDHGWPRGPMFGVAPCPTVIFTVGMLLITTPRAPVHLLIVPVLWSLIGGAAAWQLGILEDLALPIAGSSVGATSAPAMG